MPELYNTRNVPAVFWIDETGVIVRANDPIYIQRRNRETGETTVNEQYLTAVRDWVRQGPDSIYVTPAEETTRRMGPHDPENAQANAHFRLGVYLHASRRCGDCPVQAGARAEAGQLELQAPGVGPLRY